MNAAMRRVLFLGLLGQGLAVSGCYGTAVGVSRMMTDYKETHEIQTTLVPGSKLVVRNELGALRIVADEGTDCRITARVYVHAPTKREAREIGEQVQITAEPNDGTVLVSVRKPPMSQDHRFVGVDFDILVPRQAQVDCETEFGRVRLAGIEGDVKARTQFGSVLCEDTHGALDLGTEFGRVTARQIVSPRVVACTEFGSVDISCAESCPADLTAEAKTEWGKIRFRAPPDYQGSVELTTDSGAVTSSLPVAAEGRLSRSRITGSIGTGEGKLHLSSERGSVRLR